MVTRLGLLLPLWALGTAQGFAHGGATRLLRALLPPAARAAVGARRPSTLTPPPGTALQAKKFDKKYDDAFDDFRTSGRYAVSCAFPLCDGGRQALERLRLSGSETHRQKLPWQVRAVRRPQQEEAPAAQTEMKRAQHRKPRGSSSGCRCQTGGGGKGKERGVERAGEGGNTRTVVITRWRM